MGKRAEKARELFLNGYNCSQSVIGAFADLFDLDPVTAMKISEGLGGGMGRMRLTCGAVSAMSLIAGLKLSSGNAKDLKTRTEVYTAVREMSEEFKKKNGSIICSELLGGALPKDNGAAPEERTEKYYKKRPCPDCVADCAEIIEQYLLNETT